MKQFLFFSWFLFSSTFIFGMQVELNSYSFYGAETYTEIYIRIAGNSVQWIDDVKTKKASVGILLMVTHEDGTIAAFDKFSLAAMYRDSIVDFLELKRIKLNAGNYTIRLEASDENNMTDKLEIEQKLTVEAKNSGFHLSDILPLAIIKKDTSKHILVRNGYYMEPLPYHYIGKENKQLDFYLESYLTEPSSGDFIIQYAIMEGTSTYINTKPLLTKYKKLNQDKVQVDVLSLPVNTIRSGNYHILVNIIDKGKNVLTSRRSNIVISNPEADIAYLENYNDQVEHSFVQDIKAEDMDYILKAQLPITDQHQVSILGELLKSNKIRSQRQFIYQLWKAKSPIEPEKAYKSYMDVVAAVDKKFYSNVGYGFQSDRGHIFLKYGKPSNVMSVDTEVDAPPYEIWYYNNMPQTQQTNVRFLFYNPSLSHNDFKLLHSTCIGERVNSAWETVLYKSVPLERLGNSTDATQVKDNWNRNARRYFNEY